MRVGIQDSVVPVQEVLWGLSPGDHPTSSGTRHETRLWLGARRQPGLICPSHVAAGLPAESGVVETDLVLERSTSSFMVTLF